MKKKGLIISTVVMVVVLIASLTTATYAWFNAQASATVDNLTINTQAATGLQIAMTKDLGKTDKLYSGDLTYENGWNGTEGWGTFLGFSQIAVGEISHACTFLNTGSVPIFDGYKKAGTSFDSTKDYFVKAEKPGLKEGDSVVGLFTDAGEKLVPATGTYQQTTHYYTVTRVAKSDATAANIANYYLVSTTPKTIGTDEGNAPAGFYQPTSYDSKVQPEGYVKAEPNQAGTYYYLTMAVSNTINIGALGFSIEVVPSGDTNMATKTASVSNPGMAAASRIQIDVAKAPQSGNATFTTQTVAPFNAYKLNTNTKQMAKGTADANDLTNHNNDSGIYKVMLDTNLAENTVYYVTFTIWVEGKDKECNDLTTGTRMAFNINFVYAAEGNTSIADWKVTGAGTATDVSFVPVAPGV